MMMKHARNYANHVTGVEGGSVLPNRHEMVSELEHVVLVRRGRITRSLAPGRHRFRRSIDRIVRLPATAQLMTLPGQETLTSDGATIRVTAVLTVVVTDPMAVVANPGARAALYLSAQLAVRALIGSRSLEALLDERGSLEAELLGALAAETTASPAQTLAAETPEGEPASAAGETVVSNKGLTAEPLVGSIVEPRAGPVNMATGLTVTGFVVRDLAVPGELKRAVAQVVGARLAGQAALERARGETAALRSLANAGRMANDNPGLLQLRLLQTMEASTGHTFVVGTGASTETAPGV